MKSVNQKIEEAITTKNVKELFFYVSQTWIMSEGRRFAGDPSFESVDAGYGYELAVLVSQNANDFTADIAKRVIENKFNPSEKQAWCLAYQIANNAEVYRIAFNEIINQ